MFSALDPDEDLAPETESCRKLGRRDSSATHVVPARCSCILFEDSAVIAKDTGAENLVFHELLGTCFSQISVLEPSRWICHGCLNACRVGSSDTVRETSKQSRERERRKSLSLSKRRQD